MGGMYALSNSGDNGDEWILAICCPHRGRSSCSCCWLLTCDCISSSITSPLLLQLLRRLLLYGGRWFFSFLGHSFLLLHIRLSSDSLDDEWATFFGNGTTFFGGIFTKEERGGAEVVVERMVGSAWWRPMTRRGSAASAGMVSVASIQKISCLEKFFGPKSVTTLLQWIIHRCENRPPSFQPNEKLSNPDPLPA